MLQYSPNNSEGGEETITEHRFLRTGGGGCSSQVRVLRDQARCSHVPNLELSCKIKSQA